MKLMKMLNKNREHFVCEHFVCEHFVCEHFVCEHFVVTPIYGCLYLFIYLFIVFL